VILFFVKKKVLTQILVNNPKVLDQKSLPLKEKLCDIPIKFIAKKLCFISMLENKKHS